jgi:hypothetical protein
MPLSEIVPRHGMPGVNGSNGENDTAGRASRFQVFMRPRSVPYRILCPDRKTQPIFESGQQITGALVVHLRIIGISD